MTRTRRILAARAEVSTRTIPSPHPSFPFATNAPRAAASPSAQFGITLNRLAFNSGDTATGELWLGVRLLAVQNEPSHGFRLHDYDPHKRAESQHLCVACGVRASSMRGGRLRRGVAGDRVLDLGAGVARANNPSSGAASARSARRFGGLGSGLRGGACRGGRAPGAPAGHGAAHRAPARGQHAHPTPAHARAHRAYQARS